MDSATFGSSHWASGSKQRMDTAGPAPVGTCLMTSERPIFTVPPPRRRPPRAAGGGAEEDFLRGPFVLVFKRLSTGTGPVAISACCKTLYGFPKTKSGAVQLEPIEKPRDGQECPSYGEVF